MFGRGGAWESGAAMCWTTGLRDTRCLEWVKCPALFIRVLPNGVLMTLQLLAFGKNGWIRVTEAGSGVARIWDVRIGNCNGLLPVKQKLGWRLLTPNGVCLLAGSWLLIGTGPQGRTRIPVCFVAVLDKLTSATSPEI
jgi:hypothetical protein